MSDEERRQILDMLERGQISAAQAVSLLQALGEAADEAELPALVEEPLAPPAEPLPAPEPAPQPAFAPKPEPARQEKAAFTPQAEEPAPAPDVRPPAAYAAPARWKNWWLIPLWVGVGVTVISSMLMYLALTKDGMGFWFACTWFPFALGILILILGWASRSARWLHLRIQQSPGKKPERIAISLPLPIRLLAGLMRLFAPRMPEEMSKINPEEAVMILEKTSPEAPLYVVVDEEDGEHVEIYIG